jgi:drug/metabolite transporter (DMT)-like permease
MVFWAGNFIVVKGAISILPPVAFTFLRYCLAALTLLALLRWREGAIRLPRGDLLPYSAGARSTCGIHRFAPRAVFR